MKRTGRHRGPRAPAVAVAGLLVFATVSGCSDEEPPTSEPAPSATETHTGSSLTVPADAVLLLEPSAKGSGAPVQVGTAELDVSVSSIDGGAVTAGPDTSSGDRTFSFPHFQKGSPYPRAVVIARNRGSSDQLSPGAQNFAYGADIHLDHRSTGRTEDNGNNVIQRGLSSDPEMFKIDVDANLRPECTVKGRDGTVTVYANSPIKTDKWYRVQCRKRDDRLWIFVGEFLPSGAITSEARETDGRAGPVTLANPATPVSVGGKIAADGSVISSATDQFNGRIANPFVRIQMP